MAISNKRKFLLLSLAFIDQLDHLTLHDFINITPSTEIKRPEEATIGSRSPPGDERNLGPKEHADTVTLSAYRWSETELAFLRHEQPAAFCPLSAIMIEPLQCGPTILTPRLGEKAGASSACS